MTFDSTTHCVVPLGSLTHLHTPLYPIMCVPRNAGRLLFAQALQQGTMSGFFKLIEQYR